MIRLLATSALGLVLANAAFAQSPSTTKKSEQSPQSQSNSTAPSATSPSGATGSTAPMDIQVGDRLPDSVEVEEFPSTVYREAPDLREYRYIQRDTRTFIIEPRERLVIEEID